MAINKYRAMVLNNMYRLINIGTLNETKNMIVNGINHHKNIIIISLFIFFRPFVSIA